MQRQFRVAVDGRQQAFQLPDDSADHSFGHLQRGGRARLLTLRRSGFRKRFLEDYVSLLIERFCRPITDLHAGSALAHDLPAARGNQQISGSMPEML